MSPVCSGTSRMPRMTVLPVGIVAAAAVIHEESALISLPHSPVGRVDDGPASAERASCIPPPPTKSRLSPHAPKSRDRAVKNEEPASLTLPLGESTTALRRRRGLHVFLLHLLSL